jgi:YVTN family beta-propeller protein
VPVKAKWAAVSAVLIALLLAASLIVTGCATTGGEKHEAEGGGFGQLVLYLSVPATVETRVSFDVASADVRPEEGDWRRLMTGPLRLDSFAHKGQQVLLAERTMPEGRYTALRLAVANGSLIRKGQPVTLALPEEGTVQYPFSFRIQAGQVTTLTLDWAPAASIEGGYMLRPAFSVRRQEGQAQSLEVYVSNEGSNSVSVIDRLSNQVAATIAVGKAPKGIAWGGFEGRVRVVVANSGDNTLSVIDPLSNTVEQTVPLSFGERPEGVAFFTGDLQRGSKVFVSNYGSQSVSVVDPLMWREVDRVQVGNGPVALAVDPPLEQIQAGRGLDFTQFSQWRAFRMSFFNVYVANQLANSVTVITCDAQTGLPQRTTEVKVEWSPMGLAVDPVRAKVYVANSGSNNLSVIDILRLIAGGGQDAVSTLSNVGTQAVAVAADPFFERLYLLRREPPEIEYIQTKPAGQRGATTPVLATTAVGASPRQLLLDPEGRKLYVTNQGADTVGVVDKTSHKVEARVDVGRRPYAVTIIP